MITNSIRRRSLIAVCALVFGFNAVNAGSFVPKDNGKALVNPGMGWTMHFYSNVLENYGSKLEAEDVLDDFPGLSTVYLRLPWSFLEPQEGVFNWEIVDTPAQRWIQAGKKVAFRITATESWLNKATPQWVFDAGARCFKAGNILEPDYADSIFLSKVEHFVRIMALRYDNNPNIAFIDIGHFGMWGEGHTVFTTPVHGHSWGLETQKKIIDIYCKYFKHTQLVISDDFAGHDAPVVHAPIIDYALSKGVTLRDDSILVQPAPRHWYHSGMAGLFWPTLPVILEHEHMLGSMERGAWNRELLLQSVEDYHASYMSIHCWPRQELDSNRQIIDRINRRLGYRIQVTNANWPDEIKKGEPFQIVSNWKNAGVAPCYQGGYPCFTIKNERGGIVSVMVATDFNIKTLPVSKPGEAPTVSLSSRFTVAPVINDPCGTFFRTCRPGKYKIYVSVGTLDGTPTIEMPYDETDGHKRYLMGDITVTE